ncbi:unnamed protein product [marine sediment metagenome]|uniref:Uncharacterized protein n=1 Tax=marine sediment metagenome TaxID=412755 RepID=X0Z5S7_9ZZZZ
MTNLEKIENIKSTLSRLRGINPKGQLLEAQAETQIIIAETLINIYDRMCSEAGINVDVRES